MLVCLTPEHETKNYFHLETAKGETFSKKKNLYFAFVDVEKVFDWINLGCCIAGFEETNLRQAVG